MPRSLAGGGIAHGIVGHDIVVNGSAGEEIGGCGQPVSVANGSGDMSRKSASSEISGKQRIVAAAGLRFPVAKRLQPGADILERRSDPAATPIQKNRLKLGALLSKHDIPRMNVAMDERGREGPILQDLTAKFG